MTMIEAVFLGMVSLFVVLLTYAIYRAAKEAREYYQDRKIHQREMEEWWNNRRKTIDK